MMKTTIHDKMHRRAGWALTTVWLCIVMAWSAQPTLGEADDLPASKQDTSQLERDEFASVPASADAHKMVDWILQSNDHQGLPFAVVDKIHAHVFTFNSAGHLLGDAPVLLGLAKGDDGVAGIGDRPLSRIGPQERITPAGRFFASLARNLSGQEILWVNYDQSISMHALRSADPKEQRLERLTSLTVLDNRISYGCINVPAAYWLDVVLPAFTHSRGLVYVLPETRSLQSEFAMPISHHP